jgi:hypothetical protein
VLCIIGFAWCFYHTQKHQQTQKRRRLDKSIKQLYISLSEPHRAGIVGLTYHGMLIDRYLVDTSRKFKSRISKFITVRTNLIKRLKQQMSLEDSTYASHLIFLSIARRDVDFPVCPEQLTNLIVAYFREICHKDLHKEFISQLQNAIQ